MDRTQQITYMQARLVRLASEEWNMSIQAVASMFTKFEVIQFIRECFDIFHVEGDYAILDDVVDYLRHKGGETDAGIN